MFLFFNALEYKTFVCFSFQEDYLFLYSAVESYCNDQNEKDSAVLSNHLILRSVKRNGTVPRSPSIQNKVPRSPSLPNNHHMSNKAETNV